MAAVRADRSTVIPGLKYHDAPAMIGWLCEVFGFEKHLVVEMPNGKIAHSQLRLGGGMLMVGSVMEPESHVGGLLKMPAAVGGFETQFPCVVAPDADAVHARALARGAEIVVPLADQDYGGRGFACRDPEGHLWWCGTYDPWAGAG